MVRAVKKRFFKNKNVLNVFLLTNTLVLNTKMYFFKNKLMKQIYFLKIFAQNISFSTVSIPPVIVDPPHGTENSF